MGSKRVSSFGPPPSSVSESARHVEPWPPDAGAAVDEDGCVLVVGLVRARRVDVTQHPNHVVAVPFNVPIYTQEQVRFAKTGVWRPGKNKR